MPGTAADWFPGWEAALAAAPLPVEQRAWSREIVGRFLADCEASGREVDVAGARAFVDREVLRWGPQAAELGSSGKFWSGVRISLGFAV